MKEGIYLEKLKKFGWSLRHRMAADNAKGGGGGQTPPPPVSNRVNWDKDPTQF